MSGNPYSLYFHIPFCTRKCPYCHFFVLPDQKRFKDQLLKGLALEWEKKKPLLKDQKLLSIYFGGGTPSLFGPDNIEKVLSWISPPSCEITLETNPENVTLQEMQAYKKIGINRISLGVQSFDDELLNTLGRKHSSQTALKAIETIQGAGFDNISIDLMYEIPGQTVESWQKTLSHIAHLPITHLSLYNLTIEPETLFFKKKEKLIALLPSPDDNLKMLDIAVLQLEKSGLKRYEISAFAKEGFSSCHNSGYWKGRPFLGFGPSAFSYWDKKRLRNRANLNSYLKQLENGLSPVDFEEELPYPQNVQELLAIRLRLLEGVRIKDFNLPNETLESIKKLHREGYLDLQDGHAKLTARGLLFYDTVATDII